MSNGKHFNRTTTRRGTVRIRVRARRFIAVAAIVVIAAARIG